MKIKQEILDKIHIGDGLSNSELDLALKFYRELVESLECLGKEFKLAWREAFRILMDLESFQYHRGNRE